MLELKIIDTLIAYHYKDRCYVLLHLVTKTERHYLISAENINLETTKINWMRKITTLNIFDEGYDQPVELKYDNDLMNMIRCHINNLHHKYNKTQQSTNPWPDQSN